MQRGLRLLPAHCLPGQLVKPPSSPGYFSKAAAGFPESGARAPPGLGGTSFAPGLFHHGFSGPADRLPGRNGDQRKAGGRFCGCPAGGQRPRFCSLFPGRDDGGKKRFLSPGNKAGKSLRSNPAFAKSKGRSGSGAAGGPHCLPVVAFWN